MGQKDLFVVTELEGALSLKAFFNRSLIYKGFSKVFLETEPVQKAVRQKNVKDSCSVPFGARYDSPLGERHVQAHRWLEDY